MFDATATLVLIGPRGVGKSTLAVVAAMALKRKFIDLITTFETLFGISAEAFRQKYGETEYRQKEAELLHDVLETHPVGAVIAAGSTCVEEPSRQYLEAQLGVLPIVHIVRDKAEVAKYLQFHQDQENLLKLADSRTPLYRQCSNLEFVNLGQWDLDAEACAKQDGHYYNLNGSDADNFKTKLNHWALKCVQRDFVKFLSRVFGDCSGMRAAETSSAHSPNSPHSPTTTPIHNSPCISSTSNDLALLPDRRHSNVLLFPFFAVSHASDIDMDDVLPGIHALEVRVDLMALWCMRQHPFWDVLTFISTQIAQLRRKTRGMPIVYSFSRSFLQVKTNLDVYMQLVQHGLRLNVDYITVWVEIVTPEFLSSLVGLKNATCRLPTKLIACLSTGVWDVAKFDSHINYAFNQFQCDLVRVTSYALTIKDNFEISRAFNAIRTDHLRRRVIVYNEGPLGRMSRCMNRLLSPVESPILCQHAKSFYQCGDSLVADFGNHNLLRTGFCSGSRVSDSDLPSDSEFNSINNFILTAQQCTNSAYALFRAARLRFYTLGTALHQRVSHHIYNAGFRATGLPHLYANHETDDISKFQDLFAQPDFGGASISHPLKVAIFSQISNVSKYAKVIGACNSVVVQRNPDTLLPVSLYGDNTDWVAFEQCVVKHLPMRNSIVSSRTTALIIGAGGTARAAIFALARLGVCKFYIVNRTRANAVKMVDHFNTNQLWAWVPTALSTNETASTIKNMSYISRSHNLLTPDPNRPKNFGSMSFETGSQLELNILDSFDSPWPSQVPLPTIIMSCCPLGDQTVPTEWLASPTGGLAIDIVYTRPSSFLAQARARGCHWRTIDGLQILIEQARAHFEFLTGIPAPAKALAEEGAKWRQSFHQD